MAKNSTQHYRELLITLDYLLNHTDEKNPATTIKICEYAQEQYGLKFDKSTLTGNDIDRRRIGKLLEYLKDFSERKAEYVPFVLEQTSSGKYYIEQKNYLNEQQLLLLLAAAKNDKYTNQINTDFLVDRLLDVFGTSPDKRNELRIQLQNLVRSVKKVDKDTMIKINYLDQALREGKMIKVKEVLTNMKGAGKSTFDLWYRVYMMKEYKNKLHAFLLPVDTKTVTYFKNFIFLPVEKINIPTSGKEKVLEEDYQKVRDFDELFKQTNPQLAQKYGTLENMIEMSLMPSGGKTCIVSFYFHLGLKDILKRSFEEFFSEEFRYQETNMVDGIENKIGGVQGMDNWIIVTDEPKQGSKSTHGLVNISVDNKAFKSWLLSDPHGEGFVCIADMVKIIKPYSLNNELGRYFAKHLSKCLDYLSNEEIQDLLDVAMYGYVPNEDNES